MVECRCDKGLVSDGRGCSALPRIVLRARSRTNGDYYNLGEFVMTDNNRSMYLCNEVEV